MVKPVRSLMAGIGRVEKGDLHVQLPITSQDEIGQLTGSFNRMVHELEEKQALKETFGRYVDPRLVDQLVAMRDKGMFGSDRHEMTVAFADLVGYTSLSTLIPPHDLVRLLNAHFSAMSEVLHEHHAVVDKFIGDAVMAYWGPPFVEEQRHAIEACAAALALVERFDRFLVEDLPTIVKKEMASRLGLCIGIATGEMIVGNIGSDRAMSWTVIGEAVNLASRLESLNRQHGTRILVSERTRDLASSVIRFREVGEVGVKGYEHRLRIFEAIGFMEVVPG
jgi:adenylate cyclase